MLRVVVDPNVFVSAVIQPGGVSADVVRAGLAGRYRFVVWKLIDELAGVLARPKLAPYTAADQAAALVDSIVGTAELHDDPEPSGRLLRDAADEYLVALAIQASADVIASGDRDLLEAAVALAILSPRGLLDRLDALDG